MTEQAGIWKRMPVSLFSLTRQKKERQSMLLAHGTLVPHLHASDVVAFLVLWAVITVIGFTVRRRKK